MAEEEKGQAFGGFDIHAIAASFPETATTMLLDRYLTDDPGASVRVFRVYACIPAHYHEGSDEHLYVVSGRGTFWMGEEADLRQLAPGHLVFFKRGTVHAMPAILEAPLVFLAVDTPRRDPRDVVFVHPEQGTPESFARSVEGDSL